MLTADFDFDLPADRIAQHPLPRGTSRLLVVEAGGIDQDRNIADLPTLLRKGDLLVVNNTKVLPARLSARREATGGRFEILLLEELSQVRWEVLVRPARRARVGDILGLSDRLTLEVLEKGEGGRITVEFSEAIAGHLEQIGHVPLPPYIRRGDVDADRTDYQTVYARRPGAIAAPTAGLHFDTALLARLRAAGIEVAELTLHVGLGTFKPVTADVVEDHEMEVERLELPEETVVAVRRTHDRGGRVVAVGTTVVRALESVARRHGPRLAACSAKTALFITPGFEFSVVDLLLTNFHLPRSTLLMLVCAFAGKDRVLAAYRFAIESGYRFYSYGDAMAVVPSETRRAR